MAYSISESFVYVASETPVVTNDPIAFAIEVPYRLQRPSINGPEITSLAAGSIRLRRFQ